MMQKPASIRLKQQWKNDVTMHLSFIVGFAEESIIDYLETQIWCIDNKIDSWAWNPLYIDTRQKLFSSEFDRNPEKFGFTVLEHGTEWVNKRYSYSSAIQIVSMLKNDPRIVNKQKMSSWGMLYWMSMGFDSTYLKNTVLTDDDFSLLRIKELNFLEKYKKKLRTITC